MYRTKIHSRRRLAFPSWSPFPVGCISFNAGHEYEYLDSSHLRNARDSFRGKSPLWYLFFCFVECCDRRKMCDMAQEKVTVRGEAREYDNTSICNPVVTSAMRVAYTRLSCSRPRPPLESICAVPVRPTAVFFVHKHLCGAAACGAQRGCRAAREFTTKPVD